MWNAPVFHMTNACNDVFEIAAESAGGKKDGEEKSARL